MIIPKEFVSRWQREMSTPYVDLPENEKESDRKEARKMLDIIAHHPIEAKQTEHERAYREGYAAAIKRYGI